MTCTGVSLVVVPLDTYHWHRTWDILKLKQVCAKDGLGTGVFKSLKRAFFLFRTSIDALLPRATLFLISIFSSEYLSAGEATFTLSCFGRS